MCRHHFHTSKLPNLKPCQFGLRGTFSNFESLKDRQFHNFESFKFEGPWARGPGRKIWFINTLGEFIHVESPFQTFELLGQGPAAQLGPLAMVYPWRFCTCGESFSNFQYFELLNFKLWTIYNSQTFGIFNLPSFETFKVWTRFQTFKLSTLQMFPRVHL